MRDPVLVSTLQKGDYFVLESYSEKFNSVYVVTETYSSGWADCVEIHSGKDFTFGRAVPVYPVEVTVKVKSLLKEKKPVDLTNKCGSCAHASTECKELYKNQESYVRCMNPNRSFRHKYSAYRPRTVKGCKLYQAKGSEND